MEWLKGLIDINKIPTRIILLIWIISALLLFIPEEQITQFALQEFKKDYGKYFGIAFIGSSAFLILIVATWIINSINKERLKRKYKKIIIESVTTLDPYEKAVLREFYIQGQDTLKIPIDNPTVSGLINKRILNQVGQFGQMSLVGMLFNFSITKVARENITFQILDIPLGEPSEQDIQRIRDARPRWMLKIEKNRRLFEGI
jgi:hypothetical protein